jgi:hypothetical protein
MRVPRSSASSFFALASLALLVAGCGETRYMRDASLANLGVGAACTNSGQCRPGLTCDATAFTCQPEPTVMAGGMCQLTAQCMDGLYCAIDGTCHPAGQAQPGETCTDTSSCVRGAVCIRTSPGLYGTCEIPRGGTATIGDASVMSDASASGGGMTSGPHDLGYTCTDALDCLAGLTCEATSHTCQIGGTTLAHFWPGEHCTDEPSTVVRAYFEIPGADGTPPNDFFRLPFPNDIRRDASGHLNLTGFPHPGAGVLGVDLLDLYLRASERELDAFGTNQIVYFRFSGSIDFATLTFDNIHVVDLTTGNPPSSSRFGASTGGNRYLCNNFVSIGTNSGDPLEPGHTYAFYLTNGIHYQANCTGDPPTCSSLPVQRDEDFGLMLAPTPPADATKARAYTAYAPFRTYLASHAIDPNTIINAAVFTTQDPRRVVAGLRDAVRAQPAPTPGSFVNCDTGMRSPCDDGLTGAEHTRGCPSTMDPAFVELQGTLPVPVFQHGTRPYNTAGEGGIQLDAMGRPMVQSTEDVCVTVTIPRGATPPAGGWPVVLYAHGTGGSYRSGVTEGLARALADVDNGDGTHSHLALVGFDGVMHGPRRGMGVTDSPNTLFFHFDNPLAARDNVLQGAADVFALTRALETVTLPMLPTASDTTRFDTAHIFFLGHSQGATVGTLAIPYESSIAATVLSGAGGDLRVSLTTKTRPVDIASLVPLALQEPGADSGSPPLQIFQAFFERSDAVNYGRAILGAPIMGVNPRPIVQVFGLGDSYSTVPTQQALASTIGSPAANPIPGGMNGWPSMGVDLPIVNNFPTAMGGVTAALLESDPMGAYDGHFVLFNDAPLQLRVMRFLASAANGMPAVR